MTPFMKGSKQPNMSDVFKNHPQAEVMNDMMAVYRNQAITHLQQTMPAKIKSIQALLESESDPNSPLWPGHVDSLAFKPTMLQPDDPVLAKQDGKPVLPSDVVCAKGVRLEDGFDDDGEVNGHHTANGDKVDMSGVEKGVRTGPHWFEVVPQNSIQRELIKLSVREHEDLHMVTQDLRIWLELEIPVIEDGNSFGADVQGYLVKELTEAYKRSNGFQNGCRAHYGDRLKLAQDWVKYPNLMDFPAAIAASDRFDHFLLRSYLRSLLVIYGGLLTRFDRNWTKVINPKGSGSSGGMY